MSDGVQRFVECRPGLSLRTVGFRAAKEQQR